MLLQYMYLQSEDRNQDRFQSGYRFVLPQCWYHSSRDSMVILFCDLSKPTVTPGPLQYEPPPVTAYAVGNTPAVTEALPAIVAWHPDPLIANTVYVPVSVADQN